MMPFLGFLVFFALYAGAAFPSFGTDAGAELLAAAAANGVPPPPAQTLTWLLAKLALMLPLGAPAHAANLIAAALMAATVPLAAETLSRLAPPKDPAPFAHQELEQERWRATARWLTALLWGLSPGPWRCALSLGPETVGLFLATLAFRAAAGDGKTPTRSSTAFLTALAVGQWPAAAAAVPGILLTLRAAAPEDASPVLSRRWMLRALAAAPWALLGLAPGLLLIPLSLSAPPLDVQAPDAWGPWLRRAVLCPPFFPPPLEGTPGAMLKTMLRDLGTLLTLPGVLLWGFGSARILKTRPAVFLAALAATLTAPALLMLTRPAPDPASPAQAALWGLTALGLSVPCLWGYHRAGVRFPAARTALAALLPLSLASRLPLAARNDAALAARADNLTAALPAGALLWDPVAPGGIFHAQFVEGRRRDARVARRPGEAWARAEFRRRFPAPGRPSAILMSRDYFFLDAAREAGADQVFTDDPGRLPDVDPATGRPAPGRYPEDALPWGPAFRFFPADSHRLVSPSAQLPLARIPLWAASAEDPLGNARARWALTQKFAQHGLAREAEEEALAALALDPLMPEANILLGERSLETGRPDRAAVHLRRAIRRAQRPSEAWALLARAERDAGRRPAALQAARTALTLDPALEDTRLLLAETLDADGRRTAAAAEWRTLMDRRPQEKLYPWRLAKAEAAAGRPAKARAALGEYLMFPLSEAEKAEAEAFEKKLK